MIEIQQFTTRGKELEPYGEPFRMPCRDAYDWCEGMRRGDKCRGYHRLTELEAGVAYQIWELDCGGPLRAVDGVIPPARAARVLLFGIRVIEEGEEREEREEATCQSRT